MSFCNHGAFPRSPLKASPTLRMATSPFGGLQIIVPESNFWKKKKMDCKNHRNISNDQIITNQMDDSFNVADFLKVSSYIEQLKGFLSM